MLCCCVAASDATDLNVGALGGETPVIPVFGQKGNSLWEERADQKLPGKTEPEVPQVQGVHRPQVPGFYRKLSDPKLMQIRRHFDATLQIDSDNRSAQSGSALMASLDTARGAYIRVNSVMTGPIAAYNAVAPDENTIAVGDFIVAVRGEEGFSETLAKALKQSGSMVISLCRPDVFAIKIETVGRPLGVDLSFHMSSTSIVVSKIREDGAVAEFNRGQPDRDAQLQLGDCIVKANMVSGSAVKLQAELLKADTLELVVSRASAA